MRTPNIDSDTDEVVALRKTVAQQAAHIADLERQLHTDVLTGLFNRRYLREFFDSWVPTQSSGVVDALVMVDIDHFKVINDTNGHGVGDEVLARVSDLIVRCTRKDKDLVFRIGGDEIVIFLANTPREHIGPMLDRLVETVKAYRFASGIRASISCGWSIFNAHLSLEENIDRADQALLGAKQEVGKGAVRSAA